MSIHNRTEFGFDQSTSMKYLFIHYNYTPTEVLYSIKNDHLFRKENIG